MERLLSKIDSPDDLKGLSQEQLGELADDIRQLICTVVSKNGGHLAPSLGVVELTIALHAIFDCPRDKIVWDVGHQSYAHKILTGRRDLFHSLRTEDGISGFPRISESEYDVFGTGHAATAISAALGLATARDINGTDEKVVAVVGDGAMTSGLCFEGLNNAGASHRDLLVILNDNKMSISPNVGGLSKYLTDVISAQPYNRLKSDIWDLTGYIPVVKEPVRTILNRVERSLKSFIVPGSWFENLGFRYFGPVDGHDIGHLMQVLSQLKYIKGPLLLHVYTTKGKGYCYAERDATRFHGTSAFELKNGKVKKPPRAASYSTIFGDEIVKIARERPSVCGITAAMTDSTGYGPFSVEFPERFFDVGIAEGHAVTFAAGLARSGLKPFVTIYSSFLQRSYDSIIHDVALQNLPVVFCLDRAGLVGDDGPTHHGVFDLSYLRNIPGITVMAPKDTEEFRAMLAFAADFGGGPVAVRYPRGTGTEMFTDSPPADIKYGKGELLREGKHATLYAVGTMVEVAYHAAELLADRRLQVDVVNMRFVKPLDTGMIDRLYDRKKPVFTLEENSIRGGFGSAVAEYFAGKDYTAPLEILGIPDEFIQHAHRLRLLELCGLDPESVAGTVEERIRG